MQQKRNFKVRIKKNRSGGEKKLARNNNEEKNTSQDGWRPLLLGGGLQIGSEIWRTFLWQGLPTGCVLYFPGHLIGLLSFTYFRHFSFLPLQDLVPCCHRRFT
jgi:hypothetical protein